MPIGITPDIVAGSNHKFKARRSGCDKAAECPAKFITA
jgi:hypothetical protein